MKGTVHCCGWDNDKLLDSCIGNNVFILGVDKNSFVVGDGELFIVSIDDVDKDTFVLNNDIVKRLFLVTVVDEDDELFGTCADIDDNEFVSGVDEVSKNSLVVAGENSFAGGTNSVDSGLFVSRSGGAVDRLFVVASNEGLLNVLYSKNTILASAF